MSIFIVGCRGRGVTSLIGINAQGRPAGRGNITVRRPGRVKWQFCDQGVVGEKGKTVVWRVG